MADLLGGVPGIVVGVGVGAAASAALEPAIELPKQTAWQDNPNKILDAATIARLVAQGGIDLGSAHRSGLRDGYSPDKIDALVYLSQTVPGFAEGLTLWRLGLIDQSLFTHVLTKAGMDQRYVGPIVNSKTAVPLSPQIVALAIQRGLVDDQGILPVPPPTTVGKVPAFPVFPIDATAESEKSGLDKERLSVLVGNSGLSMGLVQAAQAFFRQIIELPDYYRAVAEGDTRNEWRDAILDVSRQILTADQYLEGALRGWTTLAEGKAGAAKHGMSDADSQLLYEIRRRPLTPHTITEALAKGGKFQPAANEIQDPYDAAVHQQDLGPEWYDLAKAMKYSPPSLFVIRQLLKDGVYSVAHATLRMEQLGLFPDDAALIAQAYAPTGGAAADPHVTKAENQLWTTTHRSYVGEMIDDPTATAALTAAGVQAGSVPQVLSLWGEERSLIRKQLSPAQVHKAVKEGVTNPATGQPWTQQDGIQALLARGYAQADAVTLLEE